MPTRDYVYLDYAASAPLRPQAIAERERIEALPCSGANPSSLHSLGRAAAQELDKARKTIASALKGGFRPAEIAFTSGGTESNNIAVLGMAEGARSKDSKRTKVILSAIEHDSVLELSKPLHERGFEVCLVYPNKEGYVLPSELEKRCDEHTALVSIMAANNETGAIQDIAELSRVAHTSGALFHTDAVQAFCKIALDLAHVDAVSMSAHKLGGPVGTGALALRLRCPFKRQTYGGAHELGRRAGTQDVSGACQFAAVAHYVHNNQQTIAHYCYQHLDMLRTQLLRPDLGIHATLSSSSPQQMLPGIFNLYVAGIDSETLILRLDDAGYEVSSASACSSMTLGPSHVLTAMGVPHEHALGSLRISFDERVRSEELIGFGDALCSIVETLRAKTR